MPDEGNSGLSGGVLLVLVGIFVVARTIIHDATGQNLVDRLVALAGLGGGSGPSSSNIARIGPVHAGTGGVGVGGVQLLTPTFSPLQQHGHIGPVPVPELPGLPRIRIGKHIELP